MENKLFLLSWYSFAMFMNHIDTLNNKQKRAVLQTEGPLLVLAGAGSGKTRVITHRIIHLIEKGVAPHNILAVTFTNKAAKEMRERVHELIKEHAPSARAVIDSIPTISTFHSLGVRILRENHEAIDLKRNFVIYDRSDSNKVIKKGLELAGYNIKQFEPRKILSIISKAKGDAVSRDEFAGNVQSYISRVAGEMWQHYDKTLKKEHALDFDDLLIKTLNMLKSNPQILEKYRNRFRYVHVDEYQDTNRVQYEIIRLFVDNHKNLCVVGDVDQNIYSWRGADIKNILQFERHFPNAKIVLLEENYRSTQTIIAASNDIITKNINRPEKTVFTNNAKGEKIELYAAMNGFEEAEHVAMTAKNLIRDGASPSGIAVLYRTNFQSRVLEDAFLSFGVPYQLLGTKFFERKEIKDILSFLRLALNTDSTADLTRVINTPPRGIGKITLLKIVEGRKNELKGKTAEKVLAFEIMVDEINNVAKTKGVLETLKFIIKRTGIEDYYKKDGEEGLERIENLHELVSLGTKYNEYDSMEGIEHLLDDAMLQSDQDEIKEKEEQDAVRLMTVHSAKGLEFSYVFITGLEEGLFPHEKLNNEESIDTEEERRLFYVALTRAKKKVFLSFAHLRTIFGTERVNIQSSFIKDIDNNHIESGNPSASDHKTTISID